MNDLIGIRIIDPHNRLWLRRLHQILFNGKAPDSGRQISVVSPPVNDCPVQPILCRIARAMQTNPICRMNNGHIRLIYFPYEIPPIPTTAIRVVAVGVAELHKPSPN